MPWMRRTSLGLSWPIMGRWVQTVERGLILSVVEEECHEEVLRET